MENGCRNY